MAPFGSRDGRGGIRMVTDMDGERGRLYGQKKIRKAGR